MRARVTQGMWMCPEQEPKWLAPAPRPAAGQADTMPGWEEQSPPDAADAVRPLAFGLARPSAVEQAIAAFASAADFESRLAGYLDQEFTDCRWPLRYPEAAERMSPQAALARRIRRRRSAERSSSFRPPQVPYFSGRVSA